MTQSRGIMTRELPVSLQIGTMLILFCVWMATYGIVEFVRAHRIFVHENLIYTILHLVFPGPLLFLGCRFLVRNLDLVRRGGLLNMGTYLLAMLFVLLAAINMWIGVDWLTRWLNGVGFRE